MEKKWRTREDCMRIVGKYPVCHVATLKSLDENSGLWPTPSSYHRHDARTEPTVLDAAAEHALRHHNEDVPGGTERLPAHFIDDGVRGPYQL